MSPASPRTPSACVTWSTTSPRPSTSTPTHFGFTPHVDASPAFADVLRGNLRLLLSGPLSSAGQPMADGERPRAGGWNRIHLIVDDLDAEIARLEGEGVTFRNEVVRGPGGAQVLVVDPSGNFVELFQPAVH